MQARAGFDGSNQLRQLCLHCGLDRASPATPTCRLMKRPTVQHSGAHMEREQWMRDNQLQSSSSSSSSIIFHALARVRRLPQIKSFHISLKTAHSGCKPSSFMSSLTHCSHVFLLHPRPLVWNPPPTLCKQTPNHPHSYAPDVQTISICPCLNHIQPTEDYSAKKVA